MIRLIRPECPFPKALARKDYSHDINKEALRRSNESLRKQMIEELKTEAETDKEYSAMVKNVLIVKGII